MLSLSTLFTHILSQWFSLPAQTLTIFSCEGCHSKDSSYTKSVFLINFDKHVVVYFKLLELSQDSDK